MSATVSILNVGAGDIELRFDSSHPAETLRAGRIVKDMLRRGYALLVEVERDGAKAFERAIDFDETKNCYIIADFDPVEAALADKHKDAEDQFDAAVMHRAQEREVGDGKRKPIEAAASDAGSGEDSGPKIKGRRGRKSIDAGSTRAVAVGRSAGG